MNKLILNNNAEDKKIITFTINKTIKENLTDTLAKSDKYNLKMKSDWVNEAIGMLKENPDYREMVCNAEGRNENFVFDKIYMTFQQRCFFADMRNRVVTAHPDIKGPQGAIIRAAILSRLMRENLII
jgi:hypothetical protein